MKYAIIKNQKVLNIIEADEVNAGRIADSMGAIAVQSDIAGIGQSYINGVFADVPPENIPDTPEVTEFKTMLANYIAEMNVKYATLGLLITDSVMEAAQKIEATDMTKTEAMYLDMLRRNLKDAQNNHQFYQAR